MTDQPIATSGHRILGAARIRAEAEQYRGLKDIAPDLAAAARWEDLPRERLPLRMSEIGAGGELVPHGRPGRPEATFRRTVERPDYVTADASRDRLDLAYQAGVLETALDAADNIEGASSIEQMLAHQIAAGHRASLKLAAQLNNQIERMGVISTPDRALANLEATRLAGAISRLMTTCQTGALALQRLQTGGRQIVTVQHVNVASGGQAIVAGDLQTGGTGAAQMEGECRENGR